MKTIFNQLCLITILVAITTGCSGVSSSKSSTREFAGGIDPPKNPMAAMQKIIQLGQNKDNGGIAKHEATTPISFRDLIEYLPSPPRGWKAQEPEGETNSFGNYSISQVSQTYIQDDKKMKVSIFDWAFNSALYGAFLLSTEFSQESTSGYNKGIQIDNIPGREEYDYEQQEGSLNLLVNSRFLVQIDGNNIAEQELREWWELIDYQSLTKVENK